MHEGSILCRVLGIKKNNDERNSAVKVTAHARSISSWVTFNTTEYNSNTYETLPSQVNERGRRRGNVRQQRGAPWRLRLRLERRRAGASGETQTY